MIKYIDIYNFQSHKHSFLEFDKGVNVIVGSSDSGKTAIIRALNWVVNNKPVGESFRSNWGGDTAVDVHIDKSTISRERSKKNNLYKIKEDPEQLFKAMGQGVPEEIQKAINFDDINMQYQMDSPFLLSASPVEVGRYLNQIVNLDVIDHSLSNIDKMKRRCFAKIEETKNLENKYTEDLSEYENIDKLDAILKDVEEKSDTYNQLIDKSEMVLDIIAEKEEVEEAMEDLIDIDISVVEELEEKYDQMIKVKKEGHNLSMLISEILETKSKIGKVSDRIESLKEEFDELMPEVCPLCDQPIKKEAMV